MMEIRLSQVTKRFGQVTAVDHFSITVKAGEFLVVVGPSGCGKTTLLRLIAGLEKPDRGCIYLNGTEANDIPVDKRNVQMIFQNYALWPHMKVMSERRLSNISFPLKIRNWTTETIMSHVGNITRRVGLESRLFSRKPNELSAGQKQRVALARAMTIFPHAILMDEPLANLDPPSRVKVRQEIKQWHRELGITVVYVTHIITDACTMADRIAVMQEGRLVQVGTENELRYQPTNEFVHDFLIS
jgi:multiple sugar transport system ATP-binding protein